MQELLNTFKIASVHLREVFPRMFIVAGTDAHLRDGGGCCVCVCVHVCMCACMCVEREGLGYMGVVCV